MIELLFILPFLFIFLAIFILILTVPYLAKQYFNNSIINKLLLKGNANEEFSGFWKQWFPELKIPTEMIVTIISCITIFILSITLVFLILLIRNYRTKNSSTLNFKIITVTIILSVLIIALLNLLFLNFYTLYIIDILLLINLIIIKIPLNKNLVNNIENKQFGLKADSPISLLESSITSSMPTDNNDLPFSNSTIHVNNENIASDEWISNFKTTNLLKENINNNSESNVTTDINASTSNALAIKPVLVPSGNSLNFFKGKVDLKFLEEITYETLETFIFIDFSHFKKHQKIQQKHEPVKIIEEEKKTDNSFMKQLNDLINKKSE